MKLIPPPVQALLWGFLAWLISRLTPSLHFEISMQALFAGGFITLGLIIDLWAIVGFARRKTTLTPFHPEKTTSLVTDGIYRYSRNPMYLGMLCYLIGWTYYLAHPLALIGPAGFMLIMNRYQISREERALRAQFGNEFDAYCDRVRRWI